MANKKITDLPASAALITTSVFECVSHPAGANISEQGTALQIAAIVSTSMVSVALSGGAISLNADGSVSFATGQFGVDATGNISGNMLMLGNSTLNADGSASFANGEIQLSASGLISGSALQISAIQINTFGVVSGFVVMTHTTTSPATFNTLGQNETIWDDGALLGTLTIALPATTVAGQILSYVTKAGATTVSITGTVTVGAAITTLAANASVSWQALNTTGSFIRLQ